MLQLNDLENSRRRWWSALLVLTAVFSLTLSVATRYAFSGAPSSKNVTIAQKHSLPEHSRQRLLKNAATWMPPVVSAEELQLPTSYPRIAPAGPPIPGLFFQKNLYNRPPPLQNLL